MHDGRSTPPAHDPLGSVETLDAVARDLQQLRRDAGNVSFSEIVRRIGRQRRAAGVPPEKCRPARTTVYEVFREGRARMNAELVGEIAAALGASPAEAREWTVRCRQAVPTISQPQPAKPNLRPAPDDLDTESDPSSEAEAEPDAEPTAEAHISDPISDQGEVELPWPAPIRTSPAEVAPLVDFRRQLRIPGAALVLLLIGCVGINLLGAALGDVLALPLFIDQIGTASAAIAFGPWWGVIVAAVSGTAAVPLSSDSSPLFALTGMAAALVWGYGVHRFGLGRSLARFFLLGILSAVASISVAAVVFISLFDGVSAAHVERFAHAVLNSRFDYDASRIVESTLIAVVDKLLTSFAALILLSALTAWLPGREDRTGPPPGQLS